MIDTKPPKSYTAVYEKKCLFRERVVSTISCHCLAAARAEGVEPRVPSKNHAHKNHHAC